MAKAEVRQAPPLLPFCVGGRNACRFRSQYSLITAWSFLRCHTTRLKRGVFSKSARNRLESLLLGWDASLPRRRSHSGSHGETRAFRTGPLSLPSTRTARSQTSPGRVSERRTLPLWDLGQEVLSKNAESLRDSDVQIQTDNTTSGR